MGWNCTLTEERLSEVLDRTLSRDEMSIFSAHAAECERCTQLVAQVGSLVTRMQQISQIAEPPFLASRIIAATRGADAREQGARQWFTWLPAIWQTRFAMGVVTVAATFFIVSHGIGALPHKIDLNPASLVRGANRKAHLTYAHSVKFVNDLRVVYEIQSRLSSQPQPMSEPAPAPTTEPDPGQEHRPPNSDARPNPQPVPHTRRRVLQNATELAVLMIGDGPENPLNETSRSLP
jgi:hypothetical protein